MKYRTAACRAGLAASLLSLLAGCSTTPVDSRATYEPVDSAGEARSAMATLPPAAGAPVAVLQSEVHGVLTQRIVLHGDSGSVGENAIVVKILVDKGPTDLDGPVGYTTKGKIADELEAQFTGIDMQMSQTFARNAFGPFGYAIGHPRAGQTCMYAWQFAVWKPLGLGAAPMGEPSLPVEPTSVRVRLCRTSAGEAEMLEWIKDLQVYPPNSRTAYVDPSSPAPSAGGDALGAAGVGVYAGSKAPDEPMARPMRNRRVAHHKRHHAHEVAQRRFRDVAREERASVDEAPSRSFVAPLPPATKSLSAGNPLLAPLSATTAHADDLPLPSRPGAAAPQASAAPLRASIPLPN